MRSPLRHSLHRGGTNHSGESLRQRRWKSYSLIKLNHIRESSKNFRASVEKACHEVCEDAQRLSRIGAYVGKRRRRNSHHDECFGKRRKKKTQNQEELHRKMEEMLSMPKDLADQTIVCTSDPRYQEMLSFMTEKAKERHEGKDQRRVHSKQGRSLRC